MLNWWIWPLNICLYDIAPGRRRGSTFFCLLTQAWRFFIIGLNSLCWRWTLYWFKNGWETTDDESSRHPGPWCTGAVRPKKRLLEVKNKLFCELPLEPCLCIYTLFPDVRTSGNNVWILFQMAPAASHRSRTSTCTSAACQKSAGDRKQAWYPHVTFHRGSMHRSKPHLRFLILLPRQLSLLILQKENDEFMGVNVYDTINTSCAILHRHPCQ